MATAEQPSPAADSELRSKVIPVLLGALIAAGVTVLQLLVQWQTEAERWRREDHARLFSERREAYVRFLITCDSFVRMQHGEIEPGSPSAPKTSDLRVDYERFGLISTSKVERAAGDLLNAVAGVLESGESWDHKKIQLENNFKVKRREFISAAREELRVSDEL